MNSKKNKLIIFDFDGVIINTFPISYKLYRQNTNNSEDDYRKMFEGNFFNPSTKAKESKIDYDFFDLYTPQLMDTDPEPGMIKVVKELSENDELAIVSSTLTKSIEGYLEQNEIRDCFQEILGSDVERSKAIKIKTLLKKHDKSPGDAVIITDTLGDIREGAECGVSSIAVTWGYHPVETLKIGAPLKIVNTSGELITAIRTYFRDEN